MVTDQRFLHSRAAQKVEQWSKSTPELTFKDDCGDGIRIAECLFGDWFSALDHHPQHGANSGFTPSRFPFFICLKRWRRKRVLQSRARKERREQCDEARVRLSKNTMQEPWYPPFKSEFDWNDSLTCRPYIRQNVVMTQVRNKVKNREKIMEMEKKTKYWERRLESVVSREVFNSFVY